uniref:Uncharacterized protein n=1 Tax=Steinernema glaseri TaxID=37863 RepID=A0A1I7ZJK6_9BILA
MGQALASSSGGAAPLPPERGVEPLFVSFMAVGTSQEDYFLLTRTLVRPLGRPIAAQQRLHASIVLDVRFHGATATSVASFVADGRISHHRHANVEKRGCHLDGHEKKGEGDEHKKVDLHLWRDLLWS